MSLKQKLCIVGAMLFMLGCLIGASSVYLWATGTEIGAVFFGIIAFCLVFIGFFLAASEDQKDLLP